MNILKNLGVVRRTQPSDRVPALGGSVPNTTAALSAVVVSDSDIVEVGGVSLEHGVEERVDESERGLALGKTSSVQTGEDTTPNRGRARGTVNQHGGTDVLDVEVVTDSGDIRVGTLGRVKEGGIRHGNTRLKVGLDLGGLVRGLVDVQSEPTTGGDQSIGVRARDLGLGGGAVGGLAVRGLEVSGGGGVSQHGGSNGEDVLGSTRERGRQDLDLS